MTSLKQAVEEYLSVRRSLGFKLRCPGALLRKFAEFAEARGAEYITISLALEWASQPQYTKPDTRADRMRAVRTFARYQHAIDDRTEVPPNGLLPYRPVRAQPYIYSDKEIRQLMQVTQRLKSQRGLRPHTYNCLIGLLAVSGMRISEALNLLISDVDLNKGILKIRESKFRKSRLVPIHASTVSVLRQYTKRRDMLVPVRSSKCFFVSDIGRAMEVSAVRRTFYQLSQWAGLRKGPVNRGPRLHDFRYVLS